MSNKTPKTRHAKHSLDTHLAFQAVLDQLSIELIIECRGPVAVDALVHPLSADAPCGQKQKTREDALSRLAEGGRLVTGAPGKSTKLR